MYVEDLWKLIETYGYKNQAYAELLAIHEDGRAGPVLEAKNDLYLAEKELQEFLGITEDGEVDPLANFDIDRNYHAVLLDPGMPRVEFPTPESFVTPNELRKKKDEH